MKKRKSSKKQPESLRDDGSDQLEPLTEGEIKDLVRQANQGNDEAQTELIDAMRDHESLWREHGNLTLEAERQVISVYARDNAFKMEAVRRMLAERRQEWAGPSPTPLEVLCVDRIVLAWLELHFLAIHFADSMHPGLLRARNSADRRFHAAIKSLATVRKLLPRGIAVVAVRREAAPANDVGTSSQASAADKAVVENELPSPDRSGKQSPVGCKGSGGGYHRANCGTCEDAPGPSRRPNHTYQPDGRGDGSPEANGQPKLSRRFLKELEAAVLTPPAARHGEDAQ